MEVAIIACAKQEELYIKEWIDWNKKIGIDHIFIADNNDSNYSPKLSDVIQEYINNDYITIIDYNNIHPIQPICYYEIYNVYGFDYDWFYVCDIDEFLHIPETNNDIKDFINLRKFNYFDSISINWRSYDDNDLIYYDDRPLQERFKRLSCTKLIHNGERKITKTIFKGKKRNRFFYIDSQHDCLADNTIVRRCNVLGIERFKSTNDLFGNFDSKYKCAYIAHYEYKTIEEYIWKINRGDTLKKITDISYPYKLHRFWNLNNKTKEKENFINKYRQSLTTKS